MVKIIESMDPATEKQETTKQESAGAAKIGYIPKESNNKKRKYEKIST